MQRMKLALAKTDLLAVVLTAAMAASPVYAEDFDNAGLSPDNMSQPMPISASDMPNGPTTDPSLAMAMSSDSTDSLANFGPSSGTVIGNRARELRDEVLRLRASVNLNSHEFSVLRASGAAGAVQYHSTVAAITARLQNGTTRGNPILMRQWEEANASLTEVTKSLDRLNSLQAAIDADASLASYMLESVQAAFQLSGAVDEDHDQLKLLRDEVSRLVVQLDYLKNQTTSDIERQSNYLTTERGNIQALSFGISRGELLGNSYANRPVIVRPSSVAALPQQSADYTTNGAVTAPVPAASPVTPVESSTPPNGNVGVASSVGRLLVLIRYNQPNVQYEQQLAQAVGSALERHPDAEFSVVAVSPSSGDPADLAKAQQEAASNADAVKRSLVQMGLSPSRIMSANTQVQTAQTPEVHVYIR